MSANHIQQWDNEKITISALFFSFSDKDTHYIEADVLMGTLQNADSDR